MSFFDTNIVAKILGKILGFNPSDRAVSSKFRLTTRTLSLVLKCSEKET